MAKTFEFDKCSLVGEIGKKLMTDYGMLIPDAIIKDLYRCYFESFPVMLKYHASKKNKKTGFSLKDDKGVFVLGAILNYNAPEDEESEDEGNYVLSFVTNEKDMEGMDLNLDVYMDFYASTVQSLLFSEAHVHCANAKDLFFVEVELIKAIFDFLDKNSNDSDEDVELVYPSVFTATVSIENGAKVYSVVPGYMVKQMIKNDDATEKEAA